MTILVAAIITVEFWDAPEVQARLEAAFEGARFAPAVGVAEVDDRSSASALESVRRAMQIAVDRAAAANRDGL